MTVCVCRSRSRCRRLILKESEIERGWDEIGDEEEEEVGEGTTTTQDTYQALEFLRPPGALKSHKPLAIASSKGTDGNHPRARQVREKEKVEGE